MIIDFGYYSRVVKNILYFILLMLSVYLILKLFLFFSPFLIGVILANFLEPIIKTIMLKFKLNRKTSTLISIFGVFTIIIGILGIATATILSESSNILENMNKYIPIISETINNMINTIDINKLNVSNQIKEILQSSSTNILDTASEYISKILNGILNIITMLPQIAIYTVITILATYFICSDRYYIKDQFEHHMPKIWAKKFNNHFKEITLQLINYIKAEIILVIISFIIVLIGLYLLEFMGFNIGAPLMIAIGIGLVDALPILGSGSVLIPWAIIESLIGNLKLGIGILVIYIIVLLVREFLEPRIVSSQIGIHPIFTLASMYAGFKIIGVIGLIIGPIVLIIYKNIFSSLLESGIIKTIFERQ